MSGQHGPSGQPNKCGPSWRAEPSLTADAGDALRKYGSHTLACQRNHAQMNAKPDVCDCGFEATVAALTAAKPTAAPTAEALEELIENTKTRIVWDGRGKGDDAIRAILRDFAAALKSVAPPAGQEKMREALEFFLDTWLRLVESGDAGFWNPEDDECVKKARAALSETPQRDAQIPSGGQVP